MTARSNFAHALHPILGRCILSVHELAPSGNSYLEVKLLGWKAVQEKNLEFKMVDKTDFISTLASKFQDLVEQGQPLRDDLEKNIRAIMTSTFNKMDLVTREEFEAQAAVLQRTRILVEELEKRVTALEQLAAQTRRSPALTELPDLDDERSPAVENDQPSGTDDAAP